MNRTFKKMIDKIMDEEAIKKLSEEELNDISRHLDVWYQLDKNTKHTLEVQAKKIEKQIKEVDDKMLLNIMYTDRIERELRNRGRANND